MSNFNSATVEPLGSISEATVAVAAMESGLNPDMPVSGENAIE